MPQAVQRLHCLGGVGGGETRRSCRRSPRWLHKPGGRLRALVSKAGETRRSDLGPALREELQPGPCACEIPLFPREFADYLAA